MPSTLAARGIQLLAHLRRLLRGAVGPLAGPLGLAAGGGGGPLGLGRGALLLLRLGPPLGRLVAGAGEPLLDAGQALAAFRRLALAPRSRRFLPAAAGLVARGGGGGVSGRGRGGRTPGDGGDGAHRPRAVRRPRSPLRRRGGLAPAAQQAE